MEKLNLLLIGKPNCGKTLLFNKLTGLNQKVSNFPGVTVEFKQGAFGDLNLVDLPGIYSLNPISNDEKVAVSYLQEALASPSCAGVLCILDATRLERSLLLALQLRQLIEEHNKKITFALNMIDEIIYHKLQVDIDGLRQALQAPVFAISARKNIGLDELKAALTTTTTAEEQAPVEKYVSRKSESLTHYARELAQKYGPSNHNILIRQNFLDDIFLSTSLGGIIFFILMAFFFQAIFSWSEPFMNLIEALLASIGSLAETYIQHEALKRFLIDAVIGGLGGFLVFVPQIFMLTVLIGVFEDTGYLARAAIICHRPLSFFGLTGKSFVPFLSGFACAIPAIMAARTIDSPKKRLITILTIPLMACSARLPVYALLVSFLIPRGETVFGFISMSGLIFFGIYLFGIVTALVVSTLLSHFVFTKESDTPFMLELPPYRLPALGSLLQRSLQSAWLFIKRAGPIIFMVTVILWFLASYPFGTRLEDSLLGSIGKWLAPLFAPLGVDWKVTIAILTSFIAREVFVGTLGTLFSIENAEENMAAMSNSLVQSNFSLASAVALIVFYAIAMQCASTLAIIKQETGSYKLATFTFVGYTLLAYSLALLTYQIAILFF
ncbi:MAG: ferrous iron transporter B [Oligoflexia bacterium]|nr:ferrous iron transporter B [Oligoflexia bacterium]